MLCITGTVHSTSDAGGGSLSSWGKLYYVSVIILNILTNALCTVYIDVYTVCIQKYYKLYGSLWSLNPVRLMLSWFSVSVQYSQPVILCQGPCVDLGKGPVWSRQTRPQLPITVTSPLTNPSHQPSFLHLVLELVSQWALRHTHTSSDQLMNRWPLIYPATYSAIIPSLVRTHL